MATDARYTIGPPKKPIINHDNGFLALGKRPPNWKDRVAYVGWIGVREMAEAVQGVPLMPKNDISDALAAYKHFLDGTGAKRKIAMERYVKNDASGKKWIESSMIEAQNAIFDLAKSNLSQKFEFQFGGTALSAGGSNARYPYPATENWQKAIGGFSFWITGTAHVERGTPLDLYEAEVTVHMEDMYNFNPTQQDMATGIPDSWNGAFSQTGLARQYINYGTVTREIAWSGPPSNSNTPVTDEPGRGSGRRGGRQASDNRRARNRL